MKETEFYQKHVRKMSGVLHLERIESAVGTGFPDVCAAGDGKQFLIETKVSKKGEGFDWLYFERFQLPFYQKRLKHTRGKGIFILALCSEDTEVRLWNASSILEAPREPYRKWNRIEVGNIEDPLWCFEKPWTVEDMRGMAHLMISLC